MPKRTTKAEQQELFPEADGVCLFCGRKAERLCDFVIGVEVPLRFVKTIAALRKLDMYTCDAPMCAGCTLQRGHICGSKAATDTIDYCRVHDGLDGELDRAISTAGAAAYRARMRLALINGYLGVEHGELYGEEAP